MRILRWMYNNIRKDKITNKVIHKKIMKVASIEVKMKD